MTLDEALRMTPEEFSKACKLAGKHVNGTPSKGIGQAEMRELEQSLQDFADFNSSPGSIIAIHEAGQRTL
jgi:hypothetical protein